MFNYWTEGGFIAWGQEPDTNTGRTPLRLFMDGRAQAAYNRKAFDVWSEIMSGGLITFEIVRRAAVRGQSITSADYISIGKWMDEQLTARNAWLFLMPAAVFNDPERAKSYHATRGLEHNRNWALVFFNNRQKLWVDIRTPRGRELFNGISNGRTIYPDDYHAKLNRAHNWLLYGRDSAEKEKGLRLAIEAFNLNPSPTPIMEILLVAARFTELRPEIDKFCEDYVNKYQENKAQWFKQDGYRLRIEAARFAYIHLRKVAQAAGNRKLATSYTEKERTTFAELGKAAAGKKW